MKKVWKGNLLHRMMALLLSAVLTAGTALGTAPLNVLAQENLGGYNRTQESVSGNAVTEEENGAESDGEEMEAEPAEGESGETEKPVENPVTEEPGGEEEQKPAAEDEIIGETDGQPDEAAAPQKVMRSAGVAAQTDDIASGEGWVLDADGKLTIESDDGMTNWCSLRQSVTHTHPNQTAVIEVEIQNDVTVIRERAFLYCRNLTAITLPDSVKSIEKSAFNSCENLTSITIPDGVTSIEERAFAYCYGLTDIGIPTSVTSIGESAFTSSGLTRIDLPSGVESIGRYAFENCTGLTDIKIPEKVTSLADDVFSGCSSLTQIEIPATVTSIGSRAFIDCTGLTQIEIPATVTSVGSAAFASCSSLRAVSFAEGIPITNIENELFALCTSLQEIELPSGVTTIGHYAFYECSSLTGITIPSGVTDIGYEAFYECSSLTGITIPSGVTDIGGWAFYNCSSLDSVTMQGSTPPALGIMDPDTGETGVFTDCKFVTDNAKGIKVPVGSVDPYKTAWPEWVDYITEGSVPDTPTDQEKADAAKAAVEDALKNITITNETTPEDIRAALQEALGDDVSVEGVEELEKEYATQDAPGKLTLKITLVINGETIYVTVNVSIEQLGSKTGVYVRFTDYYDMDGSTPRYKYTGLAVKPAVEVYHNETLLTLGKDYTIGYKNNIKVGSAASLTVKGKGSFTGTSNAVNFTIINADIDQDTDHPTEMTVIVNTKVAPVIMNGTKKLTTKDYQLEGEGLVNGKYAAATAQESPNTLTVKGIGSYEGSSFEIRVKVIEKSEAGKLTVTVDKNFKPVYEGNALNLSALFKQTQDGEGAITVTDSKDKTKILKEGTDFTVVCTSSLVNVGTVKFTLTGMGAYTGSVSKTFKISPLKVTDSSKFSVTFDEKEYECKASGATVDNLMVKYLGETESTEDDKVLTQGVDYKVTYSNNKKVSTLRDAGLKVTFLGNYKGSSAVSGTFKVVTAKLSAHNTVVTVPDKVYSKANGAYKSTPIVTVDGATIKSSNYTVSYAWATGSEAEDDTKYIADNKVKITIADGDTWAKVKVTVTPKETGSYDLAEGAVLEGAYYVRKTDNATNLSKAKVTFYNKAGTQLKTLEYNGSTFYTPAGNNAEADNAPDDANAVYVRVTVGGTAVDPALYDVIWTNATAKGKATVVIRGKGEATEKGMAVGSKNQAINIKAMVLKGMTLKAYMEKLVNSLRNMF